MERSRRAHIHQDLVGSIRQHDWARCHELAFRLTYGLPANLQLGLASYMTFRCLPIFEHRWPEVDWPRQILEDLDRWLKRFRRRVPEDPVLEHPADISFKNCFDGLLLGAYYRDDFFTLTTSSLYAVLSVIQARKSSVWVADDPEAVELWKNRQYAPGRYIDQNVAAKAVAEREWMYVMEWLDSKGVEAYPDAVGPTEIERLLTRWKSREMLLIVPEE